MNLAKNISLCLAMFFSVFPSPAYSSDVLQGYRHEKTVSDGEGDALPKSYSLHPFSIDGTSASIGRSKAHLRIDSDGKTSISLLTPFNSLRELDKNSAVQIFGKLHDSTFHVFAPHPDGPNIYHVDTEFDKNSRLTRYRIRGYRIQTPIWHELKKEASGD